MLFYHSPGPALYQNFDEKEHYSETLARAALSRISITWMWSLLTTRSLPSRSQRVEARRENLQRSSTLRRLSVIKCGLYVLIEIDGILALISPDGARDLSGRTSPYRRLGWDMAMLLVIINMREQSLSCVRASFRYSLRMELLSAPPMFQRWRKFLAWAKMTMMMMVIRGGQWWWWWWWWQWWWWWWYDDQPFASKGGQARPLVPEVAQASLPILIVRL